ncbi:hypothetical protein E2C06_23890 [Dankookia rubra]|uniref:Uncharacterized protein n=1 Tax=Dankookia rubra TaxID=1442381 RepID=A0A4R5QCE1_9PROT|nr:hypothetical protein E2C06_23890 [Dankookia rubra]
MPRQNSNGGKDRLGRITKMGDRTIRHLGGARSGWRNQRSPARPGLDNAPWPDSYTGPRFY